MILNFFKFNLKNLKFYLINFIFKYTKFYSKYFFIKQILGKIIKDNRAQAYEWNFEIFSCSYQDASL